jgi:hypothetical protein
MLVWTERYNCHSAKVGRVGKLDVNWDKSGYKVAAFGVTLTTLSPDVEDGKRRAIKLARRLLAEAAAEMQDALADTK